jgi:anti-sigma B factor antagonist
MTGPAVKLSGDVDIASVPAIRAELTAAVEANPGATVTVDLRDVEFLDSTGLGILVGALRRARTADGDVVLVGPRPNVAKVFSITGLDKVFTIQDA